MHKALPDASAICSIESRFLVCAIVDWAPAACIHLDPTNDVVSHVKWCIGGVIEVLIVFVEVRSHDALQLVRTEFDNISHWRIRVSLDDNLACSQTLEKRFEIEFSWLTRCKTIFSFISFSKFNSTVLIMCAVVA